MDFNHAAHDRDLVSVKPLLSDTLWKLVHVSVRVQDVSFQRPLLCPQSRREPIERIEPLAARPALVMLREGGEGQAALTPAAFLTSTYDSTMRSLGRWASGVAPRSAVSPRVEHSVVACDCTTDARLPHNRDDLVHRQHLMPDRLQREAGPRKVRADYSARFGDCAFRGAKTDFRMRCRLRRRGHGTRRTQRAALSAGKAREARVPACGSGRERADQGDDA
jgi:hypothetical protein